MKSKFEIVPENFSGTRRAVMIGINYVGQQGELSGCHNDVKNVSHCLNNKDDIASIRLNLFYLLYFATLRWQNTSKMSMVSKTRT